MTLFRGIERSLLAPPSLLGTKLSGAASQLQVVAPTDSHTEKKQCGEVRETALARRLVTQP